MIRYRYTNGIYSRNQQLETMSLSKATTATVILTIIQDGLLSLNTTVSSLISSWNNGNKAGMTLKHIIGHTNGIQETGDFAGGDWTLETAVNGLGARNLAFNPGTQFVYSTTSYQVAARMAEVVTGQTWKQLFESRIRNKCGMGNAQYMPGQEQNPNAGYGLFCTQEEYLNFMTMIKNGGSYLGQQILNSASMNLIRTDMTEGMGSWGFGFINKEMSGGIANESVCESAKGCYAWTNYSKNIACVLFTQGNGNDTITSNNELRDLVRTQF